MTEENLGASVHAHIQNTPVAEVLEALAQPTGKKSIPTPYIYDIGTVKLDSCEQQFVAATIGYRPDAGDVMPSGATLFSRIVSDPDYYVDRAERDLIGQNIIKFPRAAVVTELGPGDGHKTSLIFNQQVAPEEILLQVIDVSGDFLSATISPLQQRINFRHTPRTCEGDFFKAVHSFEKADMVLFLGTTISNFEPHIAEQLFAKIANDYLKPNGVLVLGQDGNQNIETLQYCYNDRRNHTAAFVMNGLRQIKRDLVPDLDLGGFRYHAFFDSEAQVMRMGIRCVKPATHNVGDEIIRFNIGEFIQVGQSRKYPAAAVRAMAQKAGFTPLQTASSPENVNIHFLKNG